MATKTVVAMICFIVGAILAAIAAFLPPVHGLLLALAVAAIGLGLAVQAS